MEAPELESSIGTKFTKEYYGDTKVFEINDMKGDTIFYKTPDGITAAISEESFYGFLFEGKFTILETQ